MRSTGVITLRCPHTDSELLDASPITASLTIILTTHHLYIMSHNHATPHPHLHKHIPIADHHGTLPASVLYAGVVNRYESGGVVVSEVAAWSGDGGLRFVVTMGDVDVVMRAQCDLGGMGRSVRVSDTVVIKSEVCKDGTSKVYRTDGSELFLFTATSEFALSRKTAITDPNNALLFIADGQRVLKFDKQRLLFGVDVGDTIQCLSWWGDALVVLTASGSLVLLHNGTGCRVWTWSCRDDPVGLQAGERVNSCVGCTNGVLVLTNQRLFLVQLTSLHDRHVALLPYSNVITTGDSHGDTIPLTMPLTMPTHQITIPKEYGEAVPWRQLAVSEGGLIAVAGRYGFAVYHPATRKWTIIHPHQPKSTLVFVHHLVFVDQDLLCATVTVVDPQSTATTRASQLRVYAATASPINMVTRVPLAAPPRLLAIGRHDPNNKAIALLDSLRQLTLLDSCVEAGWRQSAVADLSNTAAVCQIEVSGDTVWFVTDRGAVYTVRRGALVGNPVLCTVASVVAEEGAVRVWGVSFGLVLALFTHNQVTVYSGDTVLCRVGDVEGGVADIDISWIHYHNGHQKALFPTILVHLLKVGVTLCDTPEILHGLISKQLEQCLYECHRASLLDRLLEVTRGHTDNQALCVAVGRVARTLEYADALLFISACRLSLPVLFAVYTEGRLTHSITTLYKLLIDAVEPAVDWTRETVRVLLGAGACEDAVQVIQLAQRLGLDLVSTLEIVEEEYSRAAGRGDFVTCKRLSEVASKEARHIKLGFGDAVKMMANRIVDPNIDDFLASM